MRRPASLILAVSLALTLAACDDGAKLPEQATTGSNPQIPQPNKSIIPTVNVAKATGWPQGEMPKAAAGLAVNAFATGLVHPRWLYVLPNGDVLAALSNAPSNRPDDKTGFKGWAMGVVMGWAGAGVESPDKIVLLRDKDGDGTAETKTDFITGLHSPFGMALIGDQLYVANTDAVLRFTYQEGATAIADQGEKVTDLPAGTINHHWTKNIIASPDGSKLYATVGSNSNAAEHGLEAEKMRADILEIDLPSGDKRVFASGLRNPNGLAWEPSTGQLWTVVNERDELGSDLVPDYLTSVKEGAFYGWPFSYWGQHVDTRVEPQKPDMVAKAIKPDYALGNHVAPLGLTFAQPWSGNNAQQSTGQSSVQVTPTQPDAAPAPDNSATDNSATVPPGTTALPDTPAIITSPETPTTPVMQAAVPAGNAAKLSDQFHNGAFIGEHGSWNRKPRAGYKVVFVPFENGKPSNDAPVDVLTGFLSDDDKALGRPVGVTIGHDGSLLVADDVGNTIWRVSAASRTSARDLK